MTTSPFFDYLYKILHFTIMLILREFLLQVFDGYESTYILSIKIQWTLYLTYL